MDDITQGEVFWAKLLDWEHASGPVAQNSILGQAMQAMDDDHWTLHTILGLAVSFMPADAQPPSLALQTPWQQATVLHQAFACAWDEEPLAWPLPQGQDGLTPSRGVISSPSLLSSRVLKQLFSSLGTGPTDRVVSSIASQALGNCKEMTWSLLKPK
ncbi:hypothetical protein Y1Q_0019642 [Alligator mississippiensis]|uniref:Uncharacterized protein n=1 Tax=Alligator mississippiensis TaxID=8496 RepID=A0A151PFG4_ALLMI|nr:hypothetical protein Y1Q_0019642 [Alligator mississippiensis]